MRPLRPDLARFTRTAIYNNRLFVGRPQGSLAVLAPSETTTLARGTDGQVLPVSKVLFATNDIYVAIFAASVWSRDSWSGWHTYPSEFPGQHDSDWSIRHEFFAAPHVLRDALLGPGGFVYSLPASAFRRYKEIPGQFVSSEAIAVDEDPFEVNILDMRDHIIPAAYIGRLSARSTMQDIDPWTGLDTEFLTKDLRANEDPRITPWEGVTARSFL